MSHNILEHPSGLYVTRFAGPPREDGGPRTRYQIMTRCGLPLQLTAEQWQALVDVCAAIKAQDDAGR